MWGWLQAIAEALFGTFASVLFQIGGMQDEVLPDPEPILDTLDEDPTAELNVDRFSGLLGTG